MKINEKLRVSQADAYCANFTSTAKYPSGIKDERYFISLIFTRRASRRLPSVRLRRIIQGEASASGG
jgi:hypothetical protein